MAVEMTKVRDIMKVELNKQEVELDRMLTQELSKDPFKNPVLVIAPHIPWFVALALWPRYSQAGWVKMERDGISGINFYHSVKITDVAPKAKDALQDRAIKID